MKPQLLIADDQADVAESLEDLLALKGYETATVSTLQAARDYLDESAVHGVLLDLNLPDGDGLDWIPTLRANHAHIAIVVITGAADNIPTAVEAMRRGADQFLTKPVNTEQLLSVLEQCLELERLRKRESTRRRLTRSESVFEGTSPAAKKMWSLASTAAQSNAVVLLQGETGSGKGVVARCIHENSDRREEDYVEVNCSSLGGDLLASELFGHRKGAFTSAVEDREGLIELADGGTLFLDEIGDMDLGVQAQLLKVIEERRYRRVGETRQRTSDFRLICASNKNLHRAVEEKRFRADLYYRISVFPIPVPPLRERGSDLAAMSEHLLGALGRGAATLSSEVRQLILSYRWPGNIRELRNVLERACLLAQEGPLTPAHFSGFGSQTRSAAADKPLTGWSLEAHEAGHFRRALEAFGGDVNQAAEALGVSRATFYRKLKKHGIELTMG